MSPKNLSDVTPEEVAEVATMRKEKGMSLKDLALAMGKPNRPGTLSSLSTALAGKRGVSRKFLNEARLALGMPVAGADPVDPPEDDDAWEEEDDDNED